MNYFLIFWDQLLISLSRLFCCSLTIEESIEKEKINMPKKVRWNINYSLPYCPRCKI